MLTGRPLQGCSPRLLLTCCRANYAIVSTRHVGALHIAFVQGFCSGLITVLLATPAIGHGAWPMLIGWMYFPFTPDKLQARPNTLPLPQEEPSFSDSAIGVTVSTFGRAPINTHIPQSSAHELKEVQCESPTASAPRQPLIYNHSPYHSPCPLCCAVALCIKTGVAEQHIRRRPVPIRYSSVGGVSRE
jgi:hypothetical protein